MDSYIIFHCLYNYYSCVYFWKIFQHLILLKKLWSHKTHPLHNYFISQFHVFFILKFLFISQFGLSNVVRQWLLILQNRIFLSLGSARRCSVSHHCSRRTQASSTISQNLQVIFKQSPTHCLVPCLTMQQVKPFFTCDLSCSYLTNCYKFVMKTVNLQLTYNWWSTGKKF